MERYYFSRHKGQRIRPTPIGRVLSWNAQSDPVQRHFPPIGSHHAVEQFEGTRIMRHLWGGRKVWFVLLTAVAQLAVNSALLRVGVGRGRLFLGTAIL